MLLSEITLDLAKQYARVYDDGDDRMIEDVIIPAAKQHILDFTGLSREQAEVLPDITLACLALCTYMYDNRSMTVDGGQIGRVMSSLLGKYSRNLL